MNKIYESIQSSVEYIKSQTSFKPTLALVLGSGLGFFAGNIQKECEISYSDIPHFPVSTVSGHAGRFIFGYIGGIPAVIMNGRVHFYEGYSPAEAVLPIRVMKSQGAEILFLTNAAGGINRAFKTGSFMLINDHISSFVPSPLIGENIDRLGVRFPDMSEVYDKALRDIIKRTAADEKIALEEGVYVQTTGPNYETPAEIRMYQSLGADAVGMSTAIEAMAARHAGMRICGISCISNLAAGISKNPLTHEEIKETADKVAPEFERLVRQSIINICSK